MNKSNLFEKIELYVKLATLNQETACNILGVPFDASDIEINKAYSRKARFLHPDVNKSPEAKMKLIELIAARDILLFPERQGLESRIPAPAEDVIKLQRFHQHLKRNKHEKKRDLGII